MRESGRDRGPGLRQVQRYGEALELERAVLVLIPAHLIDGVDRDEGQGHGDRPDDADPGEHELFVRLNDMDHEIIEPEVMDSVAITVQ